MAGDTAGQPPGHGTATRPSLSLSLSPPRSPRSEHQQSPWPVSGQSGRLGLGGTLGTLSFLNHP